MSNLMTLEEIWEKADRRPVKIYYDGLINELVGVSGDTAYLVGSDEDRAYGHHADNRQWTIYQEPKKLAPHWPAIFWNDAHKRFELSQQLYSDHVKPFSKCSYIYIRLATEYPAVMLEVKDE